jgi:glutathione S-transferase
MPASRRLIGLSYSPWTEKARWALDHQRVTYAYEEYVPMLGEPFLRARTRTFRGRASVPVLLEDGEVYADSFEIALRADALGRGPRLFPDGTVEAIRAWNERAERLSSAGRALLLARMADDRKAQQESLPAWIPRAVRSVATPLAAMGVGYVARKYGATARTRAEAEETMREALHALRAALQDRSTILDRFTYADVTIAVALQLVKPVADRFIALGPATRSVWTHEPFASQFGDLLAWRDALYERERVGREG